MNETIFINQIMLQNILKIIENGVSTIWFWDQAIFNFTIQISTIVKMNIIPLHILIVFILDKLWGSLWKKWNNVQIIN